MAFYFVSPSLVIRLSFAFLSSFSSLNYAITVRGYTHCQNNESVHRKEQRATQINSEATNAMQYRPPNAYQGVSNINHFISVSDSLGLLATAGQCMASRHNKKIYGEQSSGVHYNNMEPKT